MLDLESELRRLPKVNPSPTFCQSAKGRLMHRISLEANERWFLRLLRTLSPVNPPPSFVESARVRLLARIHSLKSPLFGWLRWLKRLAVSTLALAFAVTTTLFYIEGKRPVNASENTILEVGSGDVSVKHADRLIWDPITAPIELSAGDLVRVGDRASATIHFFDDTQVRLDANSTLLVNRLSVSPAYARQGVIEISLHQGAAWVQTLNVEDGYAGFTLSTPNAIVSTPNATFDVKTGLSEPTHIRVFKHSVSVRALQPETRTTLSSGKLTINEEIILNPSAHSRPSSTLSLFAPIHPLAPADLEADWIQNNLEADQKHLEALRERELLTLKANAGTLPGEMLYPIKRAKEMLQMAFGLNSKSHVQSLADLANQRLSEAMVLFDKDDPQNAMTALDEYRSLVRQIAQEEQEENKPAADAVKPLAAVVASHRKALVAALPGDSQIGLVNTVLNQTEELMTQNPVDLTHVRLENSIQELTHAHDLLAAGDAAAAKSILANHVSASSALLPEAASLADDQKRALYENLLETQYEEKRLFGDINAALGSMQADPDLKTLAETKSSHLDNEIRQTVADIRPAMPEVVLSQAAAFTQGQKAREFADKILIYKTLQGQKNQVKRLVAKYPQYAQDKAFWALVANRVDGTAKVVIESRLADLEYQEQLLKGKQVRQKITRSVRLREKREEIKNEQATQATEP